MCSDINLNVGGNSAVPVPQETGGTEVSASIKTSVQVQIKDSVDRSEQPTVTINLAAYTANTSRPVLTKPGESNVKKQEGPVTRDLKGEDAAGTLATGENAPAEQTIIEEPIQGEAQAQQKNTDEDGNQGGAGGGGGDGESEFASKTLMELVAELSVLEKDGKVKPFDSNDINALLNNFGKAVKNQKAVGLAGSARTDGSAGAEEPYPQMTIEGNTITGPAGSYTIPATVSPPKTPNDVLNNTYHQLKGMVDTTQQLLTTMPESPDKLSLANFLKTLVEALVKFQEYLYVMNNIDSKAIREKSKAQLETSLHKLEEQRKKQEEQERKARKAGKKQKTMGIIGKVFGGVGIAMSAILVVVFIWTGPLALLACSFMIVSIASMITTQATGKGIFERAFVALGELASAMLDAMGIHGAANEWIVLIAKIMVVLVVSAAVIVSSPFMFLFGGVSNIVGFLTESGIINKFVEQCGGDEKAQMITTMVVTTAIMMTTMVVSIALMFIPGAQGALLAQIGQITTKVTKVVSTAIMAALKTTLKVTEKVAENATKVIMQMLKMIVNPGFWMTATTMGLTAVDTVNKVKMNQLLADLALMEGEMTKMIEAADALIKIFKKIIQKLLEGLTDTGVFISQTSDVLKKYFQSQSEAMTNLWSA